jgi:2-polyprenyl-6-hydroxyphenyl methylase/3-demethylubiquinone-9 3-methyltransferase
MAAEADWDEATNPFETRRRLRVIFDVLLKDVDWTGRRLLDAGSGGGHFSAEAARRGAHVVSLDVGLALLDQVGRRCHSERVVGSVLSLPFPDASFEFVLSTEVLEHTPDPQAGLRELCRIVKPGGTLLMTTPGRLWQPVVRAASALRLRRYQGWENFLWPRQAHRIAEQCGLRVEKLVGFNLLPLFRPLFERVLGLADRAGASVPSLYVNFALRASRPR